MHNSRQKIRKKERQENVWKETIYLMEQACKGCVFDAIQHKFNFTKEQIDEFCQEYKEATEGKEVRHV